MLWAEHVFCGWILARTLGSDNSWLEIVLGSILPDIPMIALLLRGHNWESKEADDLDVAILYFVPHSLITLFFVPNRLRALYALHIICDIVSHTKEWSIRPFFPIFSFSIQGFYDPWKIFQKRNLSTTVPTVNEGCCGWMS